MSTPARIPRTPVVEIRPGVYRILRSPAAIARYQRRMAARAAAARTMHLTIVRQLEPRVAAGVGEQAIMPTDAVQVLAGLWSDILVADLQRNPPANVVDHSYQ